MPPSAALDTIHYKCRCSGCARRVASIGENRKSLLSNGAPRGHMAVVDNGRGGGARVGSIGENRKSLLSNGAPRGHMAVVDNGRGEGARTSQSILRSAAAALGLREHSVPADFFADF